MPRCPNCKKYFRTLEDEERMHDCPFCGYGPGNQDEPTDEDLELMKEEEENERIQS